MSNFILPTTELSAINAMLRSIGESPIDSLYDKFADADVAQQILAEELRALQNREWTWNTELDVTLSPSVADGTVTLPQNTLRVICEPRYVQRGLKMYDRLEHTYEFEDPLVVCLVVALNFDEVPEAARRFAYIRSTRRFQDSIQPDSLTHQFTQQDELNAWAALLNYEGQVAQWNVLDNLALNLRIKRYRRPGLGSNLLTPRN